MILKKRFKPKKVRVPKRLRRKLSAKLVKELAEKNPRGQRFGHRWFPYNKST